MKGFHLMRTLCPQEEKGGSKQGPAEGSLSTEDIRHLWFFLDSFTGGGSPQNQSREVLQCHGNQHPRCLAIELRPGLFLASEMSLSYAGCDGRALS